MLDDYLYSALLYITSPNFEEFLLRVEIDRVDSLKRFF
jgi:hypothetical protein